MRQVHLHRIVTSVIPALSKVPHGHLLVALALLAVLALLALIGHLIQHRQVLVVGSLRPDHEDWLGPMLKGWTFFEVSLGFQLPI